MVVRWEKKKDVTERKAISKKIKERAEKCMCTAAAEERKAKQVGSQFTGQSKSYKHVKIQKQYSKKVTASFILRMKKPNITWTWNEYKKIAINHGMHGTTKKRRL